MQNRFLQIAWIAFAICASVATLQAANAQWDFSPTSGDWMGLTNWTPQSVPNGSADTATFDVSNITDVSLTPNIEVNGITFTNNASAYKFTAAPDPSTNLAITGSGISNNSSTTQSFLIGANDVGEYGTILFENSATAGSLTSFTTAGAGYGGGSGLVQFLNNSTAGAGTFTTNGGTATGAIGGVTQFSNNSTAANGTFINNGSAVSDAAGGGTTFFADNSTGGNGQFTTNGGQADQAQGGQTLFYGQSTSGRTVFLTNGGLSSDALGGFTSFGQFSSANGATFTANGATLAGAEGGHVSFTDNAKATGSVFTTNGGTVYRAGGGSVNFVVNAAATNCTFMLDGSGVGAGLGWVEFAGSSTAKNSLFTVNGGQVNASTGGLLRFSASTALSNDTVITNGAGAAGAAGGLTEFLNYATAGNSTLIANGGLDSGGQIYFYDLSGGGTARVEVFDNALLDVTSHNRSSPLNIGSLEGNGTVWISYNTLIVGGNNLSTTFSGSIQDLGFAEARGSLTKNGTGILALTGVNTYIGTTTVNAGTLAMNGSSANGTVVVNGGMLVVNGSMPNVIAATVSGGSLIVNGSMSGPVTVNTGTLGGLGQIGSATLSNNTTFAPGNGSNGTLNVVGDLTFNAGAKYLVQLNGSSAGSQYDQTVVKGNINLGRAMLSVKLGFSPAKGTTFTIINNAGSAAVINTFKNLKQKGKITVGKRVFQVSYIGGDGNDVVLTTVR